MNDILKQRLVGALVLIALGVVFWPVIFVESERQPVDPSPQIPAMPVLDDARIESPQALTGIEPAADPGIDLHESPPEAVVDEAAPADDGAAVEAETQVVAKAEAAPPDEQSKPRLDEQGIPIAWVLQVVSVSKREKADALTAQLIAQGHKAYHRAIRRDDQVLYRVYVGPVFERASLNKAKRDIDRELQVNAIISRYVP